MRRTVTRREVLRYVGAGATGLGGVGTAGGVGRSAARQSTDGGNRLEVRTVGEAREVRYEFVADGPVDAVTSPESVAAEPSGNDAVEADADGTYRASGVTGRGKSDTYLVVGDVLSFETDGSSGEYALVWNGEERRPPGLDGSGGGSDPGAGADSDDGSDGETDSDSGDEPSDSSADDPVEFLGCSRFRIVGEYDAVYVQWGVYAEGRAPGGPHASVGSVSGETVVGYADVFPSHEVDRSDYFHVKSVYAWEDVSGDGLSGRPDLTVENPTEGCLEKTAPEPPTLSVESITAVGADEYEVTFEYVNPAAVVVAAADEFAEGNSPDEPPGELQPGRHSFTVTWLPRGPDERLRWAFSPAGRPDETVSATAPPVREVGGQGTATATDTVRSDG